MASMIPNGVAWPRFDDGALVRIGDVIVDDRGVSGPVTSIEFYGDRVGVFSVDCDRDELVRADGRRPLKRPARSVEDTQEAIDADALKDACKYWNGHDMASCDYCPQSPGMGKDTDHRGCVKAMIADLLRRQRALAKGEADGNVR